MMEEANRRRRRPWVLLTYPAKISASELLKAVTQRLGVAMPTYQETTGCCVVEATTEEIRDRFLKLQGCTFGGDDMVIGATRHVFEMSSDELIQYISEFLKAKEDI